MSETLYQMAIRMCLTFRECVQCPLGYLKDTCLIEVISTCNVEDAEEQLAILRKWAKEHPNHPNKTYKEVFLEKFPNARVISKSGLPNVCRKAVFDGFAGFDDCVDCVKCWNEPYKEENDE